MYQLNYYDCGVKKTFVSGVKNAVINRAIAMKDLWLLMNITFTPHGREPQVLWTSDSKETLESLLS